ncbi:hypothetical protein LCGC14_1937270 [marine sediment metagenome]|uniref:Uncharacterized protein n=1 Tax=marine sediment metagenome TaxID=412755 RepID=A0A0F9IIT3_9ZZZZ
MELQPEQILIAAGLGTALVWLVTVVWIGVFKQEKPRENVMKVIVFAASTLLAFYWTPIELPDPSAGIYPFVTALLVSATTIFKISQLVYDKVWQPFTNFVAKNVRFLSFLSVRRVK